MSAAHVRKVRAPRFSDEEWRLVEQQALRCRSHAVEFPFAKGMTPHEFVREATMAVARLLKDRPRGDRALRLDEILLHAADALSEREHRDTKARAARTQSAASQRSEP